VDPGQESSSQYEWSVSEVPPQGAGSAEFNRTSGGSLGSAGTDQSDSDFGFDLPIFTVIDGRLAIQQVITSGPDPLGGRFLPALAADPFDSALPVLGMPISPGSRIASAESLDRAVATDERLATLEAWPLVSPKRSFPIRVRFYLEGRGQLLPPPADDADE
jgi:hypothetical protein